MWSEPQCHGGLPRIAAGGRFFRQFFFDLCDEFVGEVAIAGKLQSGRPPDILQGGAIGFHLRFQDSDPGREGRQESASAFNSGKGPAQVILLQLLGLFGELVVSKRRGDQAFGCRLQQLGQIVKRVDALHGIRFDGAFQFRHPPQDVAVVAGGLLPALLDDVQGGQAVAGGHSEPVALLALEIGSLDQRHQQLLHRQRRVTQRHEMAAYHLRMNARL